MKETREADWEEAERLMSQGWDWVYTIRPEGPSSGTRTIYVMVKNDVE